MLNGYSGIWTRNFGLCLTSLLVGQTMTRQSWTGFLHFSTGRMCRSSARFKILLLKIFVNKEPKINCSKKNEFRLQVPRGEISIHLKPIYVFSIQPLFSFSLLGHSEWNRRYRSQSNCITNRPTLHRLLQFFDQNSHYRIISIRIFDIFERLYLSRN